MSARKWFATTVIIGAAAIIAAAACFAAAQAGYFTPTYTIQYRNTEYGFTFTLPDDWKGFSIVSETWNGTLTDATSSGYTQEQGPQIAIRNPLWSAQKPWQDIPIMVFTHAQWNEVQQGDLIVSAAPIPPSKLGENADYVFALPPRYNYAFPLGWPEVNAIMQGIPLRGFDGGRVSATSS